MKRVLTAILIQLELTTYNDAGQVCARPDKAPTLGVLEADIPDAVKEWIMSKIEVVSGG